LPKLWREKIAQNLAQQMITQRHPKDLSSDPQSPWQASFKNEILWRPGARRQFTCLPSFPT
jgi:hypothetical protein